jgi:hypothetical protein
MVVLLWAGGANHTGGVENAALEPTAVRIRSSHPGIDLSTSATLPSAAPRTACYRRQLSPVSAEPSCPPALLLPLP